MRDDARGEAAIPHGNRFGPGMSTGGPDLAEASLCNPFKSAFSLQREGAAIPRVTCVRLRVDPKDAMDPRMNHESEDSRAAVVEAMSALIRRLAATNGDFAMAGNLLIEKAVVLAVSEGLPPELAQGAFKRGVEAAGDARASLH